MRREGAHAMSLKETSRPPQFITLQSTPPGVNRSKSFHGMPSVHSPIGQVAGQWSTPILGESFRTHMRPKSLTPPGGHGGRKPTKVPKVPRPSRMATIFSCLKKGVRECISATEDDIHQLEEEEDQSTSTAQAKILDLEKQVKSAIRYKKRLEFHLAKIEEIEEQYVLHQQLREGARTMAKAYGSLASPSSKESAHNVQCGFRECTQVMCILEAQLEALLGTFHCEVKGLAGFARMMPGDVYEVTFRHGFQKWKTKGKIGAGHVSNAQSWHPVSHTFKATVGDLLFIKAVEMKGLGKQVLLGQKNCETKDLLSSHPQLMTVAITATLKVTAVITWNPLDGIDEHMVSMSPLPSNATRRRPLSSCSPLGADFPNPVYINRESTSSDYSSDHSPFSTPSINGRPVHHSSPLSEPPISSLHHKSKSTPSLSVYGQTSGSVSKDSELFSKPKLFDMRLLTDFLEGDLNSGRQHFQAQSLEEALQSLRTNLEDYQGRYSELQSLEEQTQYLDRILQKNCLGQELATEGLVQTESNASIENALGAFDFLEDYSIDAPLDSGNLRRHCSLDALEAESTLSPESTTKTADSGIESIANRLSQASAFDSSLGSLNPELATTGNEQVDQALLWHLQYCEKLLENLGSFGPLKCKEIYSLDKLQKQAGVIDQLIRLSRTAPNIGDLQKVMSGITQKKELRHFWVRCVDESVLFVRAERALFQLERSFSDVIKEKYDISPNKVLKYLLAQVLDLAASDTLHQSILTLHQFMLYFEDEDENFSLQEYIESLAGELWVCDRLKSGDTDITIKTLLSYDEPLPPSFILRVVSLLLLVDNVEVRTAAANYLKRLKSAVASRDKVMVSYVEALEDPSADVRCAACVALKVIKANEALEQLVYVSQSDNSNVVKHRARDAVLSFGAEGHKALEQTELSSHGFQGIKL